MKTPVTISVVPGSQAAQHGFAPSDVTKPLEDYSLLLLSAVKGDKTYSGGVFVQNTNLPLSRGDMTNLREMTLRKLAAVK